jgi:hypothetical protein
MSALRKLQEQFIDYVLTGDPHIASRIVAHGEVDVETRLGIYSNAYRLRLIECLQEDFPQLHRYLGDAQFEQLCRDYIEATPSSFTSLRDYGEGLLRFLQTYAPFAHLPDVAELALFERTLRFAFDAASSSVLTIESMAAFAPEQWPLLSFRPVPSLRIKVLCYNTVEVYKQLEAEAPAQPARLLDQPVIWVIWRKPDMMSWYRSLKPDEADLLGRLCEGANFAELGEAACAWYDEHEAPMKVAQWLRSWIDEQLLASAYLSKFYVSGSPVS